MATINKIVAEQLRVSLSRKSLPTSRRRIVCRQGRSTPRKLANQTDEAWKQQQQRQATELQTPAKPTATTASLGDDNSGQDDDDSLNATTITNTNNPLAAIQQRWDSLPARYQVVAATSVSFIICNMDKVNISVAIIPMAQDFGWSPTTAGIVQSSFFYGYMLSQIPGGYITSLLGGRKVLPTGVSAWSISTAAVPIVAGTMPGLFISRALVGLGEGVAPSAAVDIVARTIDKTERARAISFIFGGLHVGSLLGLLIAPAIIENYDWPAVFYLFGGLGVCWTLWWESLIKSIADKEPAVAEALNEQHSAPTTVSEDAMHGNHHAAGPISTSQPVPWRGFLRNRPVQALTYTHFCNNWFHYTMLAWLPTFFTETLSLDLTRAAQVSILPPIAAIIVSGIAGPGADALIAQGKPIGTVRKAAQSMAFLGPAACLILAASAVGSDNGPLTVGLITMSLGLASFSLAGLYCNHADLSPRYAPVLLGLTNTAGALPGIVGVAFTGWLYDVTGSWSAALFAPSIFFFVTGSAVYAAFGSADRQDFDNDNEPLAIERVWWAITDNVFGNKNE